MSDKANLKIVDFDDFSPSPTLFSEQRKSKPRLPRSKDNFAIIPLPWLNDRNWDAVLPARLRLYSFLQYKTKRGARPWPLSNSEAEELGLTPNNKMRVLRWLETKGLVTVTIEGKETAVVSMVHQPMLPK